jgi:hypothetical protein
LDHPRIARANQEAIKTSMPDGKPYNLALVKRVEVLKRKFWGHPLVFYCATCLGADLRYAIEG